MYDNGSITGYQVMIDCLKMLDPASPNLILAELPEEVLDEMLEYARRYDPRRPHSASFPPPAEDQVRTAERWICAYQTRSAKPVHR